MLHSPNPPRLTFSQRLTLGLAVAGSVIAIIGTILGVLTYKKNRADKVVANRVEAEKLLAEAYESLNGCACLNMMTDPVAEPRVALALDKVTRAELLDPQNVEVHRVLSTIYDVRKRYEALAFEPGSGASEVKLGIALTHSGKTTEALSAFERATVDDPHDANAWADICYVYINAGNLAKAEPACLQAIKADPENAVGYHNLGDLRRHQNRIAESKSWYAQEAALKARK